MKDRNLSINFKTLVQLLAFFKTVTVCEAMSVCSVFVFIPEPVWASEIGVLAGLHHFGPPSYL